MQARIRLKPKKEKALLQRHHWIFSGAIQENADPKAEGAVPVFSSDGTLLGLAFLNPGHSIAAHVIAFGSESIEEAIKKRLQEALLLRQSAITTCDAYRLINAEGDGLPGLIVDVYGKAVVIQISSKGMDLYKTLIVDEIVKLLQPRSIYEKSTSFLRKKQGLEEKRALLWGEDSPVFTIQENGIRFEIDLHESQKTGFFLDQREMRLLTQRLANGKKVLNCFAYTGGFSLFAMKGGASQVDSVEISKKACAAIERNIQINGFDTSLHHALVEDAFDFLKRDPLDYGLIILDPPAFVKKREDLAKACRGYREINFQAMKKMPSGSLLLASSCSYHLTEEVFQTLLFQAALQAGREVKILSKHLSAFDHPVSLYHPESVYLKSFLLFVV